MDKIISSGWLTKGPYLEKFEKQFSNYLGVPYCIAVSSGTAALHIALLSIGIKKGDEVILPDFTFPACANVVEHVRAKPVLIDIDIKTFNIEPDSIENKITKKTKAIMPVHQFGLSADMDKIKKIAKKHNLFIIEDAACALGSEYKGKKCGTLGDISCFSFHPRKIITTGEGGMICTNNSKIAKKAKTLRDHGIFHKVGKKVFVMPGYNYRMAEIPALLGLNQMRKIKNIIGKRTTLVQQYKQKLLNIPELILPSSPSYATPNYQSFVILLKKSINRDKIIKKLQDKGIETAPGAVSIHIQPYYRKKYHYQCGEIKNSFKAHKKNLAIPIHPELYERDIRFIVETIKSILK